MPHLWGTYTLSLSEFWALAWTKLISVSCVIENVSLLTGKPQVRHKTDIEVVHTLKTKTTGQMPQRKGMHMSAEDTNKDHLDETRVIDTQAQDAQAHDAHADKTTYVNVAYQKEDGSYEGAWIPADEVVSREASAKPSWKKKAAAAGAAAAFLVAGFGAGWATSSVASPAPTQQSQAVRGQPGQGGPGGQPGQGGPGGQGMPGGQQGQGGPGGQGMPGGQQGQGGPGSQNGSSKKGSEDSTAKKKAAENSSQSSDSQNSDSSSK